MCFTSSDRSDDPPPRPAQLPHQQQQSASIPTPSKATMPQDFAPPVGPPPSLRRHNQGQGADFTPPPGPPPSHRPATGMHLPPALLRRRASHHLQDHHPRAEPPRDTLLPPARLRHLRTTLSTTTSRRRRARLLLTGMVARGLLTSLLPRDHHPRRTMRPHLVLHHQGMEPRSTTGKPPSPIPRSSRRRPASSAASTDRPPTMRRRRRLRPASDGAGSSPCPTRSRSPRSS